jgi:hypothetical protein
VAQSVAKVEVWNRALSRIGETEFVTDPDAADRPAAEIGRLVWDDTVRRMLEQRAWPWAKRQAKLAQITSRDLPFEGDGARVQFEIPLKFRDPGSLSVEVDGTAQVEGDDYTVTPPSVESDEALGYITFLVAPDDGAEIVVTYEITREGWDYIYALPPDCVTPLALLCEDQRFDMTAVDARTEWEIMANDHGDGRILCTNADADDEEFSRLEYTALIDNVTAWSRGFVEAMVRAMAAEYAYGLKKDQALGDSWAAKALDAIDEAVATDQGDAGHRLMAISPGLAVRS